MKNSKLMMYLLAGTMLVGSGACKREIRNVSSKLCSHNDSIRVNYHIDKDEIASVGHVINGKAQGRHYAFHQNGHLGVECYFKDGVKNGPYIFYNGDGKIKEEGTFKKGLKYGPATKYKWKNGNCTSDTVYYLFGASEVPKEKFKAYEDSVHKLNTPKI